MKNAVDNVHTISLLKDNVFPWLLLWGNLTLTWLPLCRCSPIHATAVGTLWNMWFATRIPVPRKSRLPSLVSIKSIETYKINKQKNDKRSQHFAKVWTWQFKAASGR